MYLFNEAKSPNAITADDIKKLNLKREDAALLLSLLEEDYNQLVMSFYVVRENACTNDYTEIVCKVYTKKDSMLHGSYHLTTFSLGGEEYTKLSAIIVRIQRAIEMFVATAKQFDTVSD